MTEPLLKRMEKKYGKTITLIMALALTDMVKPKTKSKLSKGFIDCIFDGDEI